VFWRDETKIYQIRTIAIEPHEDVIASIDCDNLVSFVGTPVSIADLTLASLMGGFGRTLGGVFRDRVSVSAPGIDKIQEVIRSIGSTNIGVVS
jgi:hypothetical protein